MSPGESRKEGSPKLGGDIRNRKRVQNVER